jgi:hypothetical protein
MSAKFDDSRWVGRLASADILVVVSTCHPIVTTESGVIAVVAALAKAHK